MKPRKDAKAKLGSCPLCAAVKKKHPKLVIPPDTGPVTPDQSITRKPLDNRERQR